MAFIKQFITIDKAILVLTGNSLLVCGDTTTTTANTSALITPTGSTTRDWTLSGSEANLHILANSTILYAELVWYSTVKSNVPSALDLRSIQDNAITLVTPNGTVTVVPQETESFTGTSGTIDRFRSADITAIIKASLGGAYTASNIPTSIPPTGLSNSRAGWFIAVVYRNDAFTPKSISFSTGILTATPSTPLQSTATGFLTGEDQASIRGYICAACANGEPLTGIQVLQAGPSFASLQPIGNPVGTPNSNPGTAPNNPWNSFFAGQVNVCNPLDTNIGLIDISGTHGTINHDAFVPTQVVEARNKWDLSMVDISNILVPNENQLALQLTASGTEDGVEVVAIGTQIDAVAPDIVATLTAYDADGDKEFNVIVGEQINYIVKIKNSGKGAANNVTLSSVIDPNCSFIPNSLKVNGVVQIGADISIGVNVGTIDPTGVTNVIYGVRVNSLPATARIPASVDYSYEFSSGSGSPTHTNYATTNQIMFIVQLGLLNVVKKASNKTAFVGDTLDYTVDITNTGTEKALNLFFQDVVNQYSGFVKGSVAINGVIDPSLDPNVGFNLPDLAVKEVTQVAFSATLDSLPPVPMALNQTEVTFSYLFNQYIVPIRKTIISNVTSIQIQYVEVIGQRSNNNNYPNVGDTVTYTLALTNVGNIPATKVQVKEPIIPGSSFVVGSVTVNGTPEPLLDPFVGFTIDSIAPQATTTITYEVLVNQVQPGETIENIAQIPFKYQITPGGQEISTEKDSNMVTTRSNFVNIEMIKTVDKLNAGIGESLYYSVSVTNSGNIDAVDTMFLDKIQAETVFVANSVKINGMPYEKYDPTQGFSLGTLSPNSTIIVSFEARVIKMPKPNVVYNTAQLIYSYIPDPKGSHITTTATSNTVQIGIYAVEFSFVKSVNKVYAVVGDTLVYTNIIRNTGTVVLTNVSFVDNNHNFIKVIPGSVYVNGINFKEYNPNVGFRLDDIHPSDTVSISFQVVVIGVPDLVSALNYADLTYSYQVEPGAPTITETKDSNQVAVDIVKAQITVKKTTNKSYATVGDTITYAFDVANTGNVTASNLNFVDIIPSSIRFVNESVLVNGISKPTYDPALGFSLGTLNVGQVATVSFRATVISVPFPNVITNKASVSFSYVIDPTQQAVSSTTTSNDVTTVINVSSATLTKRVDKAYATIGDSLIYTINAVNTGTVALTNVNFTDLVPTGATFTNGSVIIDGVSKPSYDPNLGFALNDIDAGASSEVVFKATVTSVPTPPVLNNTASIAYQYQLSPTDPVIKAGKTSNTVTTNLSEVTLTNTKSVSKTYATVEDTLTYTSVLANSGNTNVTNTNFVDLIPASTTFVAGSVTINGVVQPTFDPSEGFTLGVIAPNVPVTVVFEVTVSSLPASGHVSNTSNVSYEYKVDPQGPSILGNITSNEVNTYINMGSLSITKHANREFARLTDIVNYSFVVTNTGNTSADNVFFQDTIQTESSFNAGSVVINGVNYPDLNPNPGFDLGSIALGQYDTVSFNVTVNSIPDSGKLLNTGNVNFSYLIDPQGSPIVKKVISNQTTVNVNDTIVSATKTVDKDLAKIGSTLAFAVTVHNAGNVPAQNILFLDLLDSNMGFSTGSVFINGVNFPTLDPNVGFSLSDIAGGATTTVTFAATVLTRPIDNIVRNFATINYEYRLSPLDPFTAVTLTTNTTTTHVAVGELTAIKAVNKLYATVPDTITYTVSVKNTGSVNATLLSFKDLVPASTTFIPGTVVVNGVSQPSLDPNVGFSIPDLIPDASNVVDFDIRVNSLPITGNVKNTADITFSYQLVPTDPTTTKTTTSNQVTTVINIGTLTVTKSVDKNYATLGDDLKYTIAIQNVGDVICSNVFFQDIIQAEASLVQGSVIINGSSQPLLDPNVGFSLQDIPEGQTTTVSFNVTVKAVPGNSLLSNSAKVNLSYYVDPSKPAILASSVSNIVTTQISLGKLTVTKEVSQLYATLGDTLTYTVNLTNIGNVDATTVNFRDVVPTGVTFVPNSVTINGVLQPGYNPYQSFTLGTITPGATVVVQFKVTVTSLPTPSLISNTAVVTFAYRINPAEPDITLEVVSNAATTQINKGELTLVKQVDKSFATIGDILTYTTVLTNTGNVDVSNVIFTDGLQAEVSFNQGSVIVDGQSHPSYDPTVGFDLGTIPTMIHVTVSFTVTVNQNPISGVVLDSAVGAFSYKIDPNGETFVKSAQSNTVSTDINVGSMTATKTVDLAYATVLDTLNYTIVVKNTGDVTDTNLFFVDTLSGGATFVTGSVIINQVVQPDLDPIVGFSLPDLVGGNATIIQFQAKVTSVPTPPQVTNFAVVNGLYRIDPEGPDIQITATTNTVATTINVGTLSNVKSVDKAFAKVLDTLTYTSVITNVGNVKATNVQFLDTLQAELIYATGTVRINGIVNPALDPRVGFGLGDLTPNQAVTVSFDVKINVLPTPPYIENKSQVEFSYKIDPQAPIITKTLFSNTVTTQVAQGVLTAVKAVDKSIATVGDILTFTINLTNIGNSIATNIVFQDTPSTGATFKSGSVIINGVSQPTLDPTVGFSLADVGIGTVVTVVFSATVVSVPPTNIVTNQAVIDFKFLVDPKQPPISQTTYSNTTTTSIAIGNLSVVKVVDKQFATIGEYLTYTITITNTGNIDVTNIIFLDPTPKNAIFVVGSVLVNFVSQPTYNPAVGFSLDTMKPGQIIVVVYQVQVVS